MKEPRVLTRDEARRRFLALKKKLSALEEEHTQLEIQFPTLARMTARELQEQSSHRGS